MRSSILTLSAGCALALLANQSMRAAQVSETEAVAIAEWWYANEISARTTKLPPSEKQQRLALKNRHQVHYVLGRDNVQGIRKAGDAVAAYVINFEPSGFVVVAGDDALQPVLAFNTKGAFKWESPQKSFLSYFLGRAVAGAAEHHRSLRAKQKAAAHANWPRMRSRMQTAYANSSVSGVTTEQSVSIVGANSSEIYVYLATAEWDQGDHYNEVCVSQNGGNTAIPTGCVATAMAIKLRYHEWPPNGNDSHSYNDSKGSIQYRHSVDFSQSTYDWPAMPASSLISDNADVAALMYDCGVAVNMDYEAGLSGALMQASDLNNYFRYRGTVWQYLGGDKADVAYSIRCGLPTLINTSTHTMVASGYRETMSPYFYINCGWGGSDNGWYDLDYITANSPDLGSMTGAYPFSSPDNYAYVDSEVSPPAGNGDLNTPYPTIVEGEASVAEGGVLMLKAGNYAAITLNKKMKVKSYLGTAVIGN